MLFVQKFLIYARRRIPVIVYNFPIRFIFLIQAAERKLTKWNI